MFFLWPLKLAIRIASLVVFAAVVYVVATGVQVVLASRAPDAPARLTRVSAIIVLGAAAPNGSPGSQFTGRLTAALNAYRAGTASLVIVTGDGTGATGSATAAAGARWLTRRGVRSITRVDSANAISGLEHAEAILGKGTKVVVVADAVDLLFAKDVADNVGLNAQVTPAAGSKHAIYNELGALWRQATGVAAGRVIGARHASWAA